MNKPWQNEYPPGVPLEVNVDEYSNLSELMEVACAKFLGRPAFTNMGCSLSYADLDRLSRNFASYLQNVAGLKKGDRIAVQMPNLLQYPVVLFGALRAGLVVVNTNPLYTPREMEHQFKDSGASALIILANFAHLLEGVLPKVPELKTVIVTEVGDLLSFPKSKIVNFVIRNVKKMVKPYDIPLSIRFTDALSKGAALNFHAPKIESSDLAFLQYTGGTTGVSKGAMLTHRNMVANMQQISAWIGPVLKETEEIVITALPLYHIFSLTVNCFAFIKLGGQNILITNPKDLPAFTKELSKYPFSVITGVNTLFNALLNYEPFRKINFKTLKIACGGGMAVQRPIAERWKEVTGVALVEGYGLTESSPLLTCNRVDGYEKLGSIGLPAPSTDVKIIGENGEDLAQGEVGEIAGAGPQIMKGYWNRADETEKVIVNGYLLTGDIGSMDEKGYFKIVDRKKDMILVSGFNVYPNEIEEVVAMHAQVLEVAAVGVKDDKSGEAVKVFIVPKSSDLTVDEIKKHCRENLTGYKVPRYVEFRTELPKSNVGKILRRMLKEVK